MIIFDRRAGTLTTEGGLLISKGIWAGFGDAANDPSRERDKAVGPLPAGIYKFAKPRDGGHLGPFVMDLEQIEGDSFGRSLFRMHGDNGTPDPHDASHGCIIAPYSVRVRVNQETDRRIRVI